MQEFIHHPSTIVVIAMTFDVKVLMDAIQFVAPLPAPSDAATAFDAAVAAAASAVCCCCW